MCLKRHHQERLIFLNPGTMHLNYVSEEATVCVYIYILQLNNKKTNQLKSDQSFERNFSTEDTQTIIGRSYDTQHH